MLGTLDAMTGIQKIALAKIALAPCVFDLAVQADDIPDQIQLTPSGLFRARDGRPGGLPGWYIDVEIARGVIAKAEQAQGEFVVDFEHQTLNAADNGQPAPAAGWFKELEWREGEGLFARVTWTDAAKARIAAREYRYISPVLLYDPNDGRVLAIPMAALTNYPAIDGLSDLAVQAAARFSTPHEENPVDKFRLTEILGFAKEPTDEQVETALAALKASADQLEERDAEVAALKTKLGSEPTPDPAKYAPVDVVKNLQSQVAALHAQITNKEVDAVVKGALEAGRLLPAQEKWARELGASDFAALSGYLQTAPVVAALRGNQTAGKGPHGTQSDELTETELAVCRATGIKTDAFKATRQSEGVH